MFSLFELKRSRIIWKRSLNQSLLMGIQLRYLQLFVICILDWCCTESFIYFDLVITQTFFLAFQFSSALHYYGFESLWIADKNIQTWYNWVCVTLMWTRRCVNFIVYFIWSFLPWDIHVDLRGIKDISLHYSIQRASCTVWTYLLNTIKRIPYDANWLWPHRK